jgi:hypothetical protein
VPRSSATFESSLFHGAWHSLVPRRSECERRLPARSRARNPQREWPESGPCSGGAEQRSETSREPRGVVDGWIRCPSRGYGSSCPRRFLPKRKDPPVTNHKGAQTRRKKTVNRRRGDRVPGRVSKLLSPSSRAASVRSPKSQRGTRLRNWTRHVRDRIFHERIGCVPTFRPKSFRQRAVSSHPQSQISRRRQSNVAFERTTPQAWSACDRRTRESGSQESRARHDPPTEISSESDVNRTGPGNSAHGSSSQELLVQHWINSEVGLAPLASPRPAHREYGDCRSKSWDPQAKKL